MDHKTLVLFALLSAACGAADSPEGPRTEPRPTEAQRQSPAAASTGEEWQSACTPELVALAAAVDVGPLECPLVLPESFLGRLDDDAGRPIARMVELHGPGGRAACALIAKDAGGAWRGSASATFSCKAFGPLREGFQVLTLAESEGDILLRGTHEGISEESPDQSFRRDVYVRCSAVLGRLDCVPATSEARSPDDTNRGQLHSTMPPGTALDYLGPLADADEVCAYFQTSHDVLDCARWQAPLADVRGVVESTFFVADDGHGSECFHALRTDAGWFVSGSGFLCGMQRNDETGRELADTRVLSHRIVNGDVRLRLQAEADRSSVECSLRDGRPHCVSGR